MDEGLLAMIRKMISTAGGTELAVFFILVGCSLFLWSIVFLKWTDFRNAKRNSARFLAVFDRADNFGAVTAVGPSLGDSPLHSIFKAALEALRHRGAPAGDSDGSDPAKFSIRPKSSSDEVILIAMQHTSKEYFSRLQGGLSFVATIGTTTPFIGLFGTVWGIMTTFQALGSVKNPSMAVVAPGISSALIATAAGLAVAIPAVIAYGWFMSQVDGLQEKADCFIERMAVLVRVNSDADESDDNDDDDDSDEDDEDEEEVHLRKAPAPVQRKSPVLAPAAPGKRTP